MYCNVCRWIVRTHNTNFSTPNSGTHMCMSHCPCRLLRNEPAPRFSWIQSGNFVFGLGEIVLQSATKQRPVWGSPSPPLTQHTTPIYHLLILCIYANTIILCGHFWRLHSSNAGSRETSSCTFAIGGNEALIILLNSRLLQVTCHTVLCLLNVLYHIFTF